jgi:hypothetical protein
MDLDAPPEREELQGVLRRAVDGIRATPPPTAQFDEWQRRYSQTVAGVDPQRATVPAGRKRMLRRLVALAASAAVLAGIWFGLSNFTSSGPGTNAFAQTLEHIQNAKTMTWKTIFYEHITTKDEKHTWFKAHTTECAYKAPGLRREVRLDDNGQVESVEIRDTIRGRELTYTPKAKKATLSEIAPWSDDPGPFSYYRDKLNVPNLQWVGTRKTTGGEVNIFRNAFRDHNNERDWSIDFWIDTKTKRLVEVYQPGADIYDPEHDPARDNAPEEKWSSARAMGGAEKDIRYDVALDDSLFRLEPPAGYAVEVKKRDRVTEKEMIDYLGILADFNDKTFPDQLFPTPFNLMSKINRALKKPRKDLTAAEQKLLDTDRRYGPRFGTVGNAPVLVFFAWDPDSTVEKSLRYLGKGVKLGDKDRIVCWYKLKGAKDPKTYRVVYGDLSVKNVEPEDLPLPVEP